jgi:TolB protein
MINSSRSFALAASLALAAGSVLVFTQQPPDTAPPPRSQVDLIIGDRIGAQPRFAVPDCLVPGGEPELQAAGRILAQVLWDDLAFEREFRMLARDTYASVPAARTLTDLPFQAWQELGADGVLSCSVSGLPNGDVRVRARLFNTRTLESAFGVEYAGALRNIRVYAHELSDEIHRQQRGLEGVARSRITFVSDRDSESALGLVENRHTKEVYVADYDGANVQRVTVSRSLNVTPTWSVNGRAVAYTSWRNGPPDVFISHIYEGRLEAPLGGTVEIHNWLPSYSLDGSQIAFTSNRDGNSEIYLSRTDGTDLRRLTNHPGIDTSPTWSPLGHQIAFTSSRTGSPQIYVVGVDGTGLRRITFESYCDRPTWSPAPYNEIGYASRTGPGYDIKVVDLATNEVRQLTFGLGSNESPSYAANGRHLVFSSDRGGGDRQLFLIGRDGRGLRRITSTGNNEMPGWSK